MITGSFTNYLISQFKRNSASFGNMQWKRVKRTFRNKWGFIRPDYVLKNNNNRHTHKYDQSSTIHAFANFCHRACHKEGHILFLPLLILNIKGCRTNQFLLPKLSLIWTIQSVHSLASAWNAPYVPKPQRDHVSPRQIINMLKNKLPRKKKLEKHPIRLFLTSGSICHQNILKCDKVCLVVTSSHAF